LGIGIDELLALKIGIKEAAKLYKLPFVSATLRLIHDIKKCNKIDGLKNELSALYLQKYTIDKACSRQNKVVMALLNLQNRGMTEDRILQLNDFLENNGYEAAKSNS
jgi:hypothetical protein